MRRVPSEKTIRLTVIKEVIRDFLWAWTLFRHLIDVSRSRQEGISADHDEGHMLLLLDDSHVGFPVKRTRFSWQPVRRAGVTK